MTNPQKSPSQEPQQAMRNRNRRLGLILLSIVLVFFLGIVFKQVLLR
jgi:hypothetical protein